MGHDDEFYPITIFTPEELYQGPTDYFIRVHEFEHAIQNALLMRDFLSEKNMSHLFGNVGTTKNSIQDLHDDFFKKYSLLDDKDFNKEFGAMQAEWEFLNSLPIEIKERALKNVQALTDLDEGSKSFALRTLTNSSLTLDEYIELEWNAGRYNKLSFLNHSKETPSDVKSKAKILAGVGSSMALTYMGLRSLCWSEFQSPHLSAGSLDNKLIDACSQVFDVKELCSEIKSSRSLEGRNTKVWVDICLKLSPALGTIKSKPAH